MAQQTLGAGSTVPRKRAFFGALDADGWAWAGVKSAFWLVVIILLLGYIPDRAYYLTVNRTVDLGVMAWSPINFCAPENETLPCPAPVGAVVPWHPSPAELALPAPRTDGSVVQLGTRFLYVGGSDGTTAQSTVYVAKLAGTGNFDRWEEGPELPAARSSASVLLVSGSVYVIGGFDADGVPATSVYMLTPDATTGELGEWQTAPELLTLPEGRAAAAAASGPTGIVLIGGEGPSGPVATTWKSTFDSKGALGAWAPEASLVRPQADAAAAIVGDYVWLWGGHDASGPVGGVQRGTIGLKAAAGLPADPDEGKVTQWAISDSANLPEARDNAAAWAASGALYLVGGADANGPRGELYWAIPTADGELSGWKHLPVSDLPFGLVGASPVVSGPNAILVGGETTDGPTSSSARANVAPTSPFFQLGLVGATIPGLKIEGEIGQQLGYLNAAGAGTVNFIILLLIGWGFAHKERARGIARRVLRR